MLSQLGAPSFRPPWPQPVLTWLLSRPEPLPTRDGARISVGESDVAAVRTTAQIFMRMDFQFGGGHARAALAQYFAQDVCPLLDGRFTEQVGRQLFSAAAEVAQLLGWTAYDIGRHGLAQRYLIQALSLAQEADDRMMGGRLLSNLSHQANYLGHFDQAVQLARAAQEGAKGAASRDHHGDVPRHGGTSARRQQRRRRLLAGSPRGRNVVRDAGCSGDDPEWISYFDAAELAGEGAHCFRDLRSPEPPRSSSPGHELTDPAYVRTLAFIRLVHAASFVQQREPGQAVELARTGHRAGRAPQVAAGTCATSATSAPTSKVYGGDADVRAFQEFVASNYPSLAAASRAASSAEHRHRAATPRRVRNSLGDTLTLAERSASARSSSSAR